MAMRWRLMICATALAWTAVTAVAPAQDGDAFRRQRQALDKEKAALDKTKIDLDLRADALDLQMARLKQQDADIQKMPAGIAKDAARDGYLRAKDQVDSKALALSQDRAQYRQDLSDYKDREADYQRRVQAAAAANTYQPGDSLQVWWKDRYWDAKVLRAENGSYYITYPGYGHEWDEWVKDDRIRK